MEENAGFGAAEIIKLYDRWRKTFRAFNRDFAVFFFLFFFRNRVLRLDFSFDGELYKF